MAVEAGNAGAVRSLKQAGLYLKAWDNDGESIMTRACRRGDLAALLEDLHGHVVVGQPHRLR